MSRSPSTFRGGFVPLTVAMVILVLFDAVPQLMASESAAANRKSAPNQTKELNRNIINTVFERTRPAGGERRGREVTILGLFELSSKEGEERREGFSELAAAQLAVQHINRRGLLLGYKLKLITNDTKCDPGVGIDRFFHALYTHQSKRIIMLLGTACSEVTESLAKIVPYWNILQVSFGSTAPALSDRREFPLFYRTVAPDSSHHPARIAFLMRFGWDTVATFSQNEEGYSLAANDLVTELERANITCAATISFAETDFKEQLKLLRVYNLGMYGAEYAWILQDTYISSWWLAEMETPGCSSKALLTAVENLIIVSSYNSIVGMGTALSGLTNDIFLQKLREMNVTGTVSQFAPQTYDAVWAMALALRGAEKSWSQMAAKRIHLADYDYTRYDIAKELLRQFDLLKFNGISGPVSFDGSDRIGTTSFHQIQLGQLQMIAFYYPKNATLDFGCWYCVPIVWAGGQVPIAKRFLKLRVDTIDPLAFYTVVILSLIGIGISILFLGLNLRFRKLKAIKLSSPKLSTITVCGCILVYTATILLGLDHSTLPWSTVTFSTICMARIYFLSAGFSLAFGSMFAKTFRVYRIFTHSAGGLCRDKILRDTQLISVIGALLLVDAFVVSFWMAADPMERHLHNLSLEISATDRSVVFLPQVELCRSRHYEGWLGMLYAYKGLLLIVGVYMAWQTRNVKISALNDSQYIGISVYSVVITSASVVVLANLLYEKVTLAFIITAAFVLMSTTATLCLLFLPKIKDIFEKGEVYDPIIHSMGLKMEFNTRRFVLDDRRELQFRVEVQNRVYRKEIELLDAEICRLERLLQERSPQGSPQASETNLPEARSCAIARPHGSSGLPMLLLSVLPPIIPRASWPSVDPMLSPMKRNIAFSSQPKIDPVTATSASRSDSDQLTGTRTGYDEQQSLVTANGASSGVIGKIRHMFTPKVHKAPSTSLIGVASGMDGRIRKSALAIFNEIDTEDDLPFPVPPQSIYTISKPKSEELNLTGSEPRVNFVLPPPGRRRSSIVQQAGGSSSSSGVRERIRGSPRFPHRICPQTTSLTELGIERPRITFLTVKSCEQIHGKPVEPRAKWKSMDSFSKSVGSQ